MTPSRMHNWDFKQWQIKGTLLTPVHIGTGELLDPFKVVYDDGWIYEFDLSAALQNADTLVKQEFQKRLDEKMESASQVDAILELLPKLPYKEHIVRKYEVSDAVERSFRGSDLPVTAKKGIHVNITNPALGRSSQSFPIIPGSSLKGSLRTGWVDYKAHRPGVPQSFPPKKHDIFEAIALGYAVQRGGRDQPDLKLDPFGQWKFIDSSINTNTIISQLVTHRRVGRRGAEPVPDLFELIPKDTEFQCRLTKLKRQPQGNPQISQFDLHEWLSAVNEHTLRTFDEAFPVDNIPTSFQKLWQEHFDDIYNDIEDAKEDLQDGRLICITRLGRFSGFQAMTVEHQRLLKEHKGGHRQELKGKDADPFTRVLTADGLPLGYVKLEFSPVG